MSGNGNDDAVLSLLRERSPDLLRRLRPDNFAHFAELFTAVVLQVPNCLTGLLFWLFFGVFGLGCLKLYALECMLFNFVLPVLEIWHFLHCCEQALTPIAALAGFWGCPMACTSSLPALGRCAAAFEEMAF